MADAVCLEKKIEIYPSRTVNILSQQETDRMCDQTLIGQYQMFRRCALAVLNCENKPDNLNVPLSESKFSKFSIKVNPLARGICLELKNAPKVAFVDGHILESVRENLYAVLRDLVYVNSEITQELPEGGNPSEHATNQVFHILRNARALKPSVLPNLVVCWGGHNISREEYDYTKAVGYELGLRGYDVITGCGNGAMKGPMKGATIGGATQRYTRRRYIGITEPGIISSESPNPIVNHLVIMPDIEKRLEAFIRTGHAVIQFAGGVGSAEEIFYLLGVLLDPANADIPFPYIFTGPESTREYFKQLDDFIGATLGKKAQSKYKIIIDNPKAVAREIAEGIEKVTDYRFKRQDAFHFNWSLRTDYIFQQPFVPTHENMASIGLDPKLEPSVLAANIRRVFSGIVAGNVKNPDLITKAGPYQINGPTNIILPLRQLLNSFAEQNRMKAGKEGYDACYNLNAVD